MKSEVKKKMIVKMLRGRCTKVTVGKKSMEIFESFMVAIAARTRNEGVARYTHKKTREESRRATLDEEPGPEWALAVVSLVFASIMGIAKSSRGA